MTFALVLVVGLLSGAVNVMAGGGSLLTLPVLLFLGLPPALANGTNRVAILAQNVVAVSSFRSKGVGDPRTGLLLGLVAVPGAILGALVSLEIPDAWFRRILAAIIVAGLVTIIFPRRTTDMSGQAPRLRPTVLLAFLAIGFYGGFIQAGVGMVFFLVLQHLLRLDLVRVNAYKVFIVAVYTIPALAIFVWSGNVHWVLGAVLALGSSAGAWMGARVAVAGGEQVIRRVVAVALGLMAIRLFAS